jgi:hypothetical protein
MATTKSTADWGEDVLFIDWGAETAGILSPAGFAPRCPVMPGSSKAT